MPKEILGTCAQVNAIRSAWLPAAVQDHVGHLLSWMYYGDLAKYGLRRSAKGHFSSIRDLGRVPLLDIGTMDMIERGKIEVVPAIARLHPKQVELEGGRRLDIDAIILATGYHSGLRELIDDPASQSLLNARGQPPVIGVEAGLPDAYFVGYTNPSTGILRHISIDSEKVLAAMR
jgi:cation diffusion facilitator CzcD-associated flavoprotein CzcO